MKKTILVFAIATLIGFTSPASENPGDKPVKKNQTQVMVQDVQNDFKEIPVDNVPEAVRKAAIENNSDAIIESAEEKVLANGEKLYKLKVSGDQSGEETKTFYSNGREFLEEANEEHNEEHIK